MSWLRRLFGDGLPDGFPGELEPAENALAVADVASGGHLVVTELGLWLPEGRRVGWHLISKAGWADGDLTVVEAEEVGAAGAAMLLADREPVRFTLPRPGKLPVMVRQRVDGSIRGRHRQELTGGGVWFVQRKVPGRDGSVLQARPDPGVDPEVVAAIAREAAERLAQPEL
ncbi:hypothetical protein LWP59_09660 [Amycolatopsis acidiphila]|uniref:Uncharacterized protein n=1 Tax=Amycolatopsis acidiphila TaxID=715473 RepID=A0A558A674_9PSEU|nr:hypothetical protein [Amycolatopsis acidiphila]TVT19774.1 hypothetical protein FNH06_23195 [Amycolatopsis acidiphila]UIJ61859.1 hypothetical protein LWP59_09660 [Amycolatopsis acidiphila]GHG57517.1 hypothetical protein GCM10017788_09180 [Amycolatopsis acidiphila]